MCMMIRGTADRLWLMKITIYCFDTFPAFPRISRSLLHEILSDKLRFRNFFFTLGAEHVYG
jgi:hypothetical protein